MARLPARSPGFTDAQAGQSVFISRTKHDEGLIDA